MRMYSSGVYVMRGKCFNSTKLLTDNSEMDSARVLASTSFSFVLFAHFCLVCQSKVRAHIILPGLAFVHIYTHSGIWNARVFNWFSFLFNSVRRFYFFSLRSVSVCAQHNKNSSYFNVQCNTFRFRSDETCLWHHHIHDIFVMPFRWCYTLVSAIL